MMSLLVARAGFHSGNDPRLHSASDCSGDGDSAAKSYCASVDGSPSRSKQKSGFRINNQNLDYFPRATIVPTKYSRRQKPK
jgi:hypothetical protein